MIIIEQTNIQALNASMVIFNAINEQSLWWIPSQKPVFDLCEEYHPTWLFITQQSLTQSVMRAIKEYNIQVVLYGVNAPVEIQDLVKLVIVPPNIHPLIQKHIKVNSYMLHECADIFLINKCPYDYRYESDIFYFASTLTDDILNILYRLGDMSYNLKIAGPTYVPLPEFVGYIGVEDLKKFYGSTKLVLDCNNNSALNVLANNIMSITNLNNLYNAPHYTSDVDAVEIVDKMIQQEKLRNKIKKELKKDILAHHTNFNRFIDISNQLQQSEWSAKATELYRQYL